MPVDLTVKAEAIQGFLAQYLKLEDAARIDAMLAFCNNSLPANGNGNTSHSAETKEKGPKKNYSRGPYKYVSGLVPDVVKLLKRPEFVGRNLGYDFPKELTEKLREVGAIRLDHTEEHIKKTLSDKIGPKKTFILQANGRINLYANLPKTIEEVATAK